MLIMQWRKNRVEIRFKNGYLLQLHLRVIKLTQNQNTESLREKCPNTELFWSVFSRSWTEYEKMRTRKTPYLDIFRPVNEVKKTQ